jgi:hypothetical protein
MPPRLAPPTILSRFINRSTLAARRPIRFTHPQLAFTRTMATDDKTKSEDEWRAVLNKEQFRILRQKGTEPGEW